MTLTSVSSQRTLTSPGALHSQSLHTRKMTQTPQYNQQVVSSVITNKVMTREGQIQSAMGAPTTIQQTQSHTLTPQTVNTSTNFLKSIDKHHQNLQLLTTRKVGAHTQRTESGRAGVSQIQKSPQQQLQTNVSTERRGVVSGGSRDSNASEFNQVSTTGSQPLAQSYSHFTLNNMQMTTSGQSQKSPFYSPKSKFLNVS